MPHTASVLPQTVRYNCLNEFRDIAGKPVIRIVRGRYAEETDGWDKYSIPIATQQYFDSRQTDPAKS